MGYHFSGFFIDQSNPELIEAIRTRWPLVQARAVESPFLGYGIAFPDYQRLDSDEEAELILEERYAAFDELPAFSANYPDVTFLWVDVDCFGGNCLYSGYGCRSGQTLVKQERPAMGKLGSLVHVLGVKLGPDQFFLPFTRGFFRF